jgi:hypothetical protein
MIKALSRIALTVAVIGVAAGCGRQSTPPRTLTIAYTNDMLGSIRTCGCSDKDSGGLGRRATFLAQARDSTGDFLLFEGGDFFGKGINYGAEKADLTMRAMKLMRYDGVVIGEADLGFGIDFIHDRAQALKLPIVVSNLWDAAADTLIFPATREVKMPSGLRVGIIGVIGNRLVLPPQVKPESVRIDDPVEAVSPLVAAMRDSVDVVVVLAHMQQGEMERVANMVDGIDVIVYGHEGEADRRVEPINGVYTLQTVADRGRWVGIAFAVLGDKGHIKSISNSFTQLTDYYADDEAVTKLFESYDLNIAAKENAAMPVGVYETKKAPKVPYSTAEACKDCHEDIYDQWAGTKHAHAFEILQAKSRESDRDCTPCHTTGFYKLGGFVSYKSTPELTNVQCEACHGIGHDHVEDPAVKTVGEARKVCQSCHDQDMSPDFDFDVYWPRIQHGTTAAAE